MKLRLFLLLLLAAMFPSLSSMAATVTGVVVNGNTGAPLSGAYVSLVGTDASVGTNFNGQFRLDIPDGATGRLAVQADSYDSWGHDIVEASGLINLGEVRLAPVSVSDFYGEAEDLVFDESLMEDEEGASQGISSLTGANDNIYYNTASYNFGPMYFNYRGMDNAYQTVYINGIPFNDLLRGRFNFSSLLGMTSRAFRNKTATVGLDAANYGFGDLGGSVNYNTLTDLYAPGFNGSVAYTNSNYMMRAMFSYSSGLNKHGWAFSATAIGRYAKEGVMEGTFYNSYGLFLSVEKVLNKYNTLNLSVFGGPTQRATGNATYQEAYDLAGSNLYNPMWGWQDGKKRSAKITETFDPTAVLNWIFKKDQTTLNTAFAFRSVSYSRSALQYYKARDPNPTYYRYLPSYYDDYTSIVDGEEVVDEVMKEQYELYLNGWKDGSLRQINWDDLYQINYLNNIQNQTLPADQKKGSSYIMENRVNRQINLMFNSYINTRINSWMTLQGGVTFNYTRGSNYKTIRDLLGGEFWLDVDPFSDREISIAPQNLQNDLDNPNRHVVKGDRFGYDYNIHAMRADAWIQNVLQFAKWDVNYGLKMSYTQYFRDGKMRNGRAPNNSLGHSETLRFDNAMLKLGALYKLDGRNQFALRLEYGTRAPLVDNVFLAPRVKNTVVDNPCSERDFSGDISYIWNYRRFRGSITGFYNQFDNVIERTGFYDDRFNSYTNYVMTGVKRVNKGVELGMAFKITPSITATFAGTYSRYQYKNNPKGTRTFENGLYPDTTQTIYLKNYYVGSTPQFAANLGVDYAAPKNWFFNVNATIQGDSYVNLAPAYHEALPDLWKSFPDRTELENKINELSGQDKLKNAFTLNASIGKLIYINRKVSLNINVNVNNILNNRDIVTYAYQQGRLDTKNYDRDAYPNRLSYAQGIKVFVNAGIRF